jgi:hypothetical protein
MRNSLGLGVRSRDSSARPIDLERGVLRQLCHARLTRQAWAKIARELREYAWQDVEHRLVYAAIERLGSRDPKMLREQLPAQATRMGFPDIDWQAYFSPEGKCSRAAGAVQIMQLIRALRGVRGRRPAERREIPSSTRRD